MAVIDVEADITGNVWKIVAKVGDRIEEDEPLMILESMKMEIPVLSPEDGKILEIVAKPDTVVTQGQVLAKIETD